MYCGVDTSSPEWAKLKSETEGVGLFEAVKDAVFRSGGVARPVEDVVRSIMKEDLSKVLQYQSRFPEIASEFITPVRTVSMFQGFNELDNRSVNYFTMDAAEAQDYGSNVRRVTIDLAGTLAGDTKTYRQLMTDFQNQSGIQYDLYDNSTEGLQNQEKFYNFLRDKEYTGIDYTMFSDSPYVVLFGTDNILSEGITRDGSGVMVNELDLYLMHENFKANESSLQNTAAEFITNKPNQQVKALIGTLIDNLGDTAEANFITVEEAKQIHRDLNQPYNNQPAFFWNGAAYFVSDNVTPQMAFHEFSHPFVKALRVKNPKLYNTLIDGLLSSQEGQLIYNEVLASKPNESEDSPKVYDEVIVKAMTEAFQNITEGNTETPQFKTAIGNILYRIRQFLRKLFSKGNTKVRLDKLGLDTTINELAEMLLNKKIADITAEDITEQDVIDYMENRNDVVEDLLKLNSNTIAKQVTFTYNAAADYLRKLKDNGYTKEIANLLKDRFSNNELREIQNNLYAQSDKIYREAATVEEEMRQAAVRAEVFATNLYKLQNIVTRINEDARNKAADAVTPEKSVEAMYALTFYKGFANYWTGYIRVIKEELDNPEIAGTYIKTNSPLYSLISNIQDEVDQLNKTINRVDRAAIGPVLYEQLMPMAAEIDEKYTNIIDILQKRIDASDGKKKDGYIRQQEDWKAKYEAIRLTPEKFEMILSGKLGDGSQANSFLESYLHNQDPVVSSIAMFVKNRLTDVDLRTAKFQNKFNKIIGPKLRENGLDKSLNPAAYGEAVTFLDESYENDKNGNLVKFPVWTILSPHKNYRYFRALQDKNIKELTDIAEKSGTQADKDNLRQAKADKFNYELKYFYMDFDVRVYAPDIKIDSTPEGREAREEYSKKWQEINSLDKSFYNDPNAYTEVLTRKKQLLREISELTSDKYINGDPKVDTDTNKPLTKAKLLREWMNEKRQYKIKVKNEGAFQTAITDYMQRLINKNIDPASDEFKQSVDQFLTENTKKRTTKEFDDLIKELLEQRKAIFDKIPEEKRSTMSDDEIFLRNVNKAYRDPDTGELLGLDVPDDILDEVRQAQQRINEEKYGGGKRYDGLTTEEADFYADIVSKLQHNKNNPKDRLFISKEDMDKKVALDAKKQAGDPLSKADKLALRMIRQQLEQLRVKQATDQYLNTFNALLEGLDTDSVVALINSTTVNRKNIEILLERKDIIDELAYQGKKDGTLEEQELYKNSKKFAAFFAKNHVNGVKRDETTKANYEVWEPLNVWREVMPTEEKYYETLTYVNAEGVDVTIPFAPSDAYYSSYIDPKWRTEKIVGKTVDNKYKWLPRVKEDAPADSPFINEQYYEIKKNNPALFELIQATTELYLDAQNKKPKGSKMYLDAPRFRIEGGLVGGSVETFRTGKDENLIKRWYQNARDFFKDAKDDYDQGIVSTTQRRLSVGDFFDDDRDGIPVHGISNLEHQNVSLELSSTILRYAYSLEVQKELLDMNPILKAVKNAMRDPLTGQYNAIQPIEDMNKKMRSARSKWFNRGGKRENIRAKTIDNFYDWMFLGQNNTGVLSQKWIVNLTNKLFKRASLGFFGLNIDSALVNYFDAVLQNNIEAAAGKYLNLVSYQRGLARSGGVMASISFSLYADEKDKSLDVQVSMAFDPTQGYFQKTLGRSLTRSLARDAAEMTWLTSTRQWLDMQASLSVLWGMMEHKKITRTIDGVDITINYADAWEKVDGQLKLKDGVNLEYSHEKVTHDVLPGETLDQIAKKYDVTVDRIKELNRLKSNDLDEIEQLKISNSEEFKKFRNRVQGVITNIQGAFAKFDQPEANRYVAYRYITFLQKYFTRGLLKRFAHRGKFWSPEERYDIGTGDSEMGFYVQALSGILRNVRNVGNGAMFMTDEEKKSTMRMVAEAATILINSILIRLLFGFDMGDDDKFNKIRERSGPLPGLFTDEDNPDFDFGGWLGNHALYILLKTKADAEAWIPIPGLGLDDYTQKLALTSAVYGTTFEAYSKILGMLPATIAGDDAAFYRRDIGPYSWQKEGGSKMINYTMKAIGITGNNVEPGLAIKNFVQIEKKKAQQSIFDILLSNLTFGNSYEKGIENKRN